MTLDLTNFPRALVAGSPLGHVGLDETTQAQLRALGYEPQDFRQATGPRQVELYLSGCLLGTIEYEEKKFKALEAARKHYSKQTKESAEAGLKDKGDKPDALKLLAGLGTEQEVGVTPTRRGRPPGSKTRRDV